MKKIAFLLTATLGWALSTQAQTANSEDNTIQGPIEENVGGGIFSGDVQLFLFDDQLSIQAVPVDKAGHNPIEEDVMVVGKPTDDSQPRLILSNGLNVVKASLYPNPTRDRVYLDMKTESDVNVNIFDFSGRLLYSNILYNGDTYLDINNLRTGVYIILARSADGIYQGKLIVE